MPIEKQHFDLATLSIEELVAFESELRRVIEARISAEKAALLEQLKAINRLEGHLTSAAETDQVKRSTKRPRAKPAPKFRNPITGETWSGRGLQPRWLRTALESGHRASEFRVNQRKASAA